MNLKKLFGFIVTAFACAMMLFSSAAPAFADTPNTSPKENYPEKGAEPMEEIESKSKEVIDQGPRSLEESRRNQGSGLNLVQGDSDAEHVTQDNPGQTDLNQKLEKAIDRLTGNG